MTNNLRVGLAQINTTVGDLDGNVQRLLEYAERARETEVDVVCFPELAVTGYPPEDLLLRPSFIRDNLDALQSVVRGCSGITAVVGFVDLVEGDIYNAAAVIHNGRLAGVYHKQLLPNYGVFDEFRYFRTGRESRPLYTVGGTEVGVNICEDIWHPGDPTQSQAIGGAQVILNISGSPFHSGKSRFREQMLATRARDYGVFVCYTNQVGGQDELVFDGGSVVLDPAGEVVARAAMFEEDLLVCDLDIEKGLSCQRLVHSAGGDRVARDGMADLPRLHLRDAPFGADKTPIEARLMPPLEEKAEVYAALVVGTRDYVRKTGFTRALVALSGGIDSSLVATVAVDALGSENVIGIAMPSRYSSEGSVRDARALADMLGIELMIIPIEPAHTAYLEMLAGPFGGGEPGVAEENLQSRVRGNLIMALSNRHNWLVLATGNKSEMATGYATLYGDMAGGFAVIKDVPKTLVYRLSHYRNRLGERPLIPQSVITKPPSAELRPNQLDQDSLPPYEVLDPILEAYVEEDKSSEEIAALGYDYATVERVIQMVNRNEYKRRQAPPGVKITPRAFGRDRRLPIANRYQGF